MSRNIEDDISFVDEGEINNFEDFKFLKRDALNTFNFTSIPDEKLEYEEIVEEKNLANNNDLKFLNTIIPAVEGEHFDFKRTYRLRKSTIKKLNILKAENDNLNIYISQIVDTAICKYYDAVILKGEKQSL